MARSNHKRMGREALLELPSFRDETIYCEAMHEPEDVLYSGSDDECYESPAARLHCYEEHARQFLQGNQPFLLSASLRGPFGKESGWKNPWRGKGTKKSVISKRKRPRTRDGLVSGPSSAAQAPSHESASHSGAASPKPHIGSQSPSESELWRSSTAKPEKRMVTESSWLRRDNLKRPNSHHDDDVLAVSPTKTIHRSKSRKLADSTRAFSEPVEIDDSAVFGGIRDLIPDEPPSQRKSAGEKVMTESQNTAIGRAELLPANCSPLKEVSRPGMPDLQVESACSSSNSSHNEAEAGSKISISGTGRDQAETQLDGAESIASTDASEVEASKPESPSIGELDSAQETCPPPFDGTTLVSANHEEAMEEDVLMRNVYEAQDASDLSNPESDVSTDMPENAHTVASRLLSKLEAIGSQTIPETPVDASEDSAADETPDAATITDTEKSRLATQDQSPWAKNVDIPPSAPCQAAVEAVEEPPVLESLEAEANQPQLDKNSLGALTRVQTQSPWLEEPSFDAPFLGRKGLSSSLPLVESARFKRNTDSNLRVSLSQNPWVEESSREHNSFSSSLPDRLISPCSPDSRERPQTPNQQEEEVALPVLSAILIPSSLGTAPSTPETKQSSLPTPDLTVSIKSFRRFRSPTPTPPPRQRTKQSGGLRSVLVHPRSRRSGSPSNKHSRRVRFDMQEPGEETESNALFAYHYGLADDDDELSGCQASSNKASALLHHGRATSPPPQDAVMAGVLPSEVEKFKGHFATVTNRSQWQAAAKGGAGPAGSSLRVVGQHKGALSDDFGSSTLSTEAMSETLRLQGRPAQDRHSTSRKEHDFSCEEDKENSQEAGHDDEGRQAEEADIVSNVDDVEEVLQNLGDFLGMWDVDTELANI